MESIQGLSTWCIENKKYHNLIVRHWMKWLRKSDASHRLNLLYLANDVIQNCKRRNAIVYRTTFADALPEAVQLVSKVKDSKVRKSVERILSIWEERSVYAETFISQLRDGLVMEAPPAPVNPTAALKSKIVAEFVPSGFIERLSKYRKSMDEIELREKQLAAMRVDVCNMEALKKLKDKAGGKKFLKDFEDGSSRLQEFVVFMEGQVKRGNPLMEALENADIFYEMQYKEVKIIAKAYQTFANRVQHLKRKLDTLKGSLPNQGDSPIPSPSLDAPSPTGSESPFRGLGPVVSPDPDLDGLAMEDGEVGITLNDAPSPLSSAGGSPGHSLRVGDTDNRDVEDMELSDADESEGPAIIVEAEVGQPVLGALSNAAPVPAVTQSPLTNEVTPAKQTPPPVVTHNPAAASVPINLAGVDLGKISSILSTITNAMKNSGGNSASRPSHGTSTTHSAPTSALTTPTLPTTSVTNPLASVLSKVDINPSTLLSALSKTQAQGAGLQGLSSFLNNQAGKTSLTSPDLDKVNSPNSVSTHIHPSTRTNQISTVPSMGMNELTQMTQTREVQREPEANAEPGFSSLESKIDSFLLDNPALKGYNMGFPSVLTGSLGNSNSPALGMESFGGTPVRDESGATPTQDEILDTSKPESYPHKERLSLQIGLASAALSSQAASSVHPMSTSSNDKNLWEQPANREPSFSPRLQNGGDYHQKPLTGGRLPSSLAMVEDNAYHQFSEPLKAAENVGAIGHGPRMGEAGVTPVRAEGRWYEETYGNNQEKSVLGGAYDDDPPLRSFLTAPLPPIPKLPPPPQGFMSGPHSGPATRARGPTEPPDRHSELSNIDNDSRARANPLCYEDGLSHPSAADERFQSTMANLGPRHRAPGPHHAGVSNDQPRTSFHHSNIAHHSPGPPPPPPPPSHGYHSTQSPPQSLPENQYFDPVSDYPPRSPSPPSYLQGQPPSEHLPPHHANPRPLRPHHLEHRAPFQPEHRTHPYPEHGPPPASRPYPGRYPTQRPHAPRRPPPASNQYPGEPPFHGPKRPGQPFGPPPRGRGDPFYPPKRPFLPPRY